MRKKWVRRFVNFWPPLFFTGIKATRISPDFRDLEVVLKLHWYNRNYVGTQFGGSLFAMTDPWYMLMLTYNLGSEYYVWDKGAHIDYVAPGRGLVRARFQLDDATLEQVRAHTHNGDKYLPEFTVDVVDEQDKLVARVKRILYVRHKPQHRQRQARFSPSGEA